MEVYPLHHFIGRNQWVTKLIWRPDGATELPQTSGISITWELVRSATSQAPLQIYWIIILKVLGYQSFTCPPGDSEASQSFSIIVLEQWWAGMGVVRDWVSPVVRPSFVQWLDTISGKLNGTVKAGMGTKLEFSRPWDTEKPPGRAGIGWWQWIKNGWGNKLGSEG